MRIKLVLLEQAIALSGALVEPEILSLQVARQEGSDRWPGEFTD